ncbi:RGN.2 family protein [Megaselia abdita]
MKSTLFLLTLLVFSAYGCDSDYKFEKIPGSNVSGIGEQPHWDSSTQSLYYVDVENAVLLRYNSQENKVHRCKVENVEFTSFIVPVEGKPNIFAVGCGRDINLIEWNGYSEPCTVKETIATIENLPSDLRFNHGNCDPSGRLFAGTAKYSGDVYTNTGAALYKYNNGEMEEVLSDVGIANGLIWDKSRDLFYFNDGLKYNSMVYDYDIENGEIITSSESVFTKENIEQEEDPSYMPDGVTITSEGYPITTVYKGGKLLQYNRDGEIVKEFCVPTKTTTSSAFGGEDLEDIYVTSEADGSENGGYLFKLSGSGFKGASMSSFKLEM